MSAAAVARDVMDIFLIERILTSSPLDGEGRDKAMSELSARRRHVLGIIVPQVVPSYYGDAKFKRIDANWKPGAGYTTCGGLPSHVANQLGVTEKCRAQGILGSGLASLRDAAMMQNAWVHHDLTRLSASDAIRPKPGDIYMLCSGEDSAHKTNCICLSTKTKGRPAKVEHVGVIVHARGTLWKTADAGQPNGNLECALYCERTFNPAIGWLTGETDGKGGKPMRRLCGWLDIEKYPFIKYPL